MTDDKSSTSTHSWRPRRISLPTIIFAALAVISFLAIAGQNNPYGLRMGYGVGYSADYGGVTPPSIPTTVSMPMGAPSYDGVESGYDSARAVDASGANAPMVQGMAGGKGGGMSANYAYAPDYYPYPYPSGDVPATDTRELLKVNYSASMEARDVVGLTRRVETTVRGHEGRIDQISSSPKSGFVSFVVPVSTYDAFRSELESVVDSRFLTVNIQSSNMLPQKQSIEEQQKQASSTVAEYQTTRQKLVSTHAGTVRSLQSQIDANAAQLASLRAQTPTYDIQMQIRTLSDESTSLKDRLVNENSSYTYQLNSIDANIKYAKEWQTAVKTQDKALLDSVATVNGSVSIQWISLWDMAQAYLPGYWIPAIFAILTVLSFLWDRRRFGMV